MGFGDRIRKFFAGRGNPSLKLLEEFARDHKGVEGYIEPRTATNPTTLLLVDREGNHVRGPVREPEDAAAFCERLGLPVYDAAVIGYPERMRRRRMGNHIDDEIEKRFAEIERQFSEESDDDEGHTS